jgi:hypothetical protein
MPTPISPTDKSNFIDLVRVAPSPGGPQEAIRLQDIFNTYDDVIIAIGRQLSLYSGSNAYLIECMATLNDTDLKNVFIFNMKIDDPSSGPSNPRLICNSTFTGTINITSNSDGLVILGNSSVSRVQLAANVNLANLYLGPGCTVDVLDASASGAFVSNIWLTFMNNTASSLNSVVFGSGIGAVHIDEGAYYGGQDPNDPQLPCAKAVTGLAASDITNNSVALSWTPAADGWLFLNLYYKKKDSSVWIQAGEAIGGYFVTSGAPTGYTFGNLDPDTWYDFRVSVRCNNGGVAVTQISAQTVCCATNPLSMYKDCPITMTIQTPATPIGGQYLCNGIQIDTFYPPGTTVAIPYLASVNCAVLNPFIYNGVSYQNVPFDPYTGTWDVSGVSGIGSLSDGDVVSVNVSLPA